MLCQKTLKSVLQYDPSTGLFTWIADTGRRRRVGTAAGSLDPKGYFRIKVLGKKYFAHRLAWLYVHGEWPTLDIDHIDRDRTNNRISNLRPATRSENRRNSADCMRPGLRGIYYIGWRAEVIVGGRRKSIGNFKTEEEAITAQRKYLETVGVATASPNENLSLRQQDK